MIIHSRGTSIVVAALGVALSSAFPLAAQILPREPINTSPTVYSGVPPTGFRVTSSTPVSANFSWDVTPGGMSYTLMRTTGVGQPWTTLTPTPLPAATLTYTDNSGIDYRTTYIYRLSANYSSGPAGYVDLPVTLLKPMNPSGVTAKQNGDGSAALSWSAVAGVPAYTVFGPGVPGGAMTVNNPSAIAVGLPLGTQTWSVASVYQPGNITTPAAEFPSASTVIEKWSGNYRVSVIGFTNQGTTTDDPLDGDGKGDEILPEVFWQRFVDGAVPRLADQNWARGATHGDNGRNFKSRVRAGSGQPTGGILGNDIVPAGFIGGGGGSTATNTATSAKGAVSTATTFPITIWEGQLVRNSDVLVLYPSLWEADEQPGFFKTPYEQAIGNRTSNAASNASIRAALDQAGISEVRGELAVRMPARGIMISDRPIGVEAVPGATGTEAAFFDRVIVLSMRKIEEALSQPPKYPGMPAGTIGLSFFEPGVLWSPAPPDAVNFSGKYVLYLMVERR